ncbi:acyl-CoA/acyl-ACP dehydrogenase [bacterium]|nr:acyl-CoA/acyl-ACP dehydrogenase [bacterium]
MDFGLSQDQELLQQSAAEFLVAECPPTLVREVARGGDGYPRALYRKMAELGWMGLVVPEQHGGSGLGMLDLALLCEQLGRAVVPGPFFSSAVLATLAILHGGASAQRKRWLPRLASGEAVGTLALLEESDRLDAAGVAMRARKRGGTWTLSGSKLFVTDAHVADLLVVACRTGGRNEEGVTLFLVPRETPGVTVLPLPSIDVTRRTTEVRFEHVELPADAVLGSPGRGWRTVARVRDAAAVLLAADSLGGAQRALELAVEYSKVREQFGRVIGSFQAVKHLAAEMVSEIEPARALVWYAAYAADALPREAPRAASMAKACLSDVYSRVANRAVQIHGGIGFTWEHDLHFWFKRAKWNELAFGDATWHRERVATLAKL